MGQVDDLSGSSCPLRTTSTWDYGVGPLRCSLVRGLFRHQLYLGLIAGLGPLTPVVGSGSASPASHVPCRSTKDGGPKFLCTWDLDRRMASLLSSKNGLRRIGLPRWGIP